MTTTHKPARATRPAPLPSVSPADHFQHGYHAGAQAARTETRWGTACYSADEVSSFISTRLDPARIERQRDAARNPLPLAYHAGFVAGYLVTVFGPAPACESTKGGNAHA
jgi:hypothetical protein